MFYKMYRDIMVYAGGGRALQMRRSRIWLRFAKQSEGQNAKRSVQGSPTPHVNWYFTATLYNHGIQIDGHKSNILIASAEQTKRSRQNFVATLFQLSTLNSQLSTLNSQLFFYALSTLKQQGRNSYLLESVKVCFVIVYHINLFELLFK